jgi:uncharacterized protein DUF1918
MVDIGARIEVESERVGAPPKCGVVTGLNGPLVQVRWDDGHETSFIPAAGSMRVVPTRRRGTRQAR